MRARLQGMDILKSYVGAGEKVISPLNEKLQYSGRIDFEYEGGPLMVYPCSYVKIKFNGNDQYQGLLEQ